MLNLLGLATTLHLRFNQWFLLRRKERKLTQDQLASALGVSGQTISNWETGRSIPTLTINQVKTLCRLLDCTLDEIPDGQYASSEGAAAL